MLKLLYNTGVTGQSLPSKNDFEHARGPHNSAYAVNLTYDRHTDILYISRESRLNTPVWGSLRSPNNIFGSYQILATKFCIGQKIIVLVLSTIPKDRAWLQGHAKVYSKTFHWKKNGISYNSSEKDMYLTCHSDMSVRHIIKDMPYFF